MLNPIDYSISKFSSFVDEETLREIEAHGVALTFKKGEVIGVRGDPADDIYYIVDGLIQIGIDGVDGSRFNLTRLGAGHTFGEMSVLLHQPIVHDIHAISNVSLVRMGRGEIRHLMQSNIAFTEAMLKVAYMRLHTTLSHIGDTLNISLESRVAKLIYSIFESNKHDENFINCRQVDLAHGLGVSRVSIGKALKGLVSKKLINLGYGKIDIISVSKLRSFINDTSSTR